MKKNLLLYIGVLMMFLAGCQDEGMFTPEEDTSETPVNVSFRVKMGGEEMSRAIGDASLVNELIVGVFQDSKLLKTFTFTREEGQEKFTNVTIPLFKNQTYDLAFWAQVKNNGIYSIDDDFNITIDYSKYKDISLAGTEAFEAFSYVREGVTVANPGEANITLTRPFAQLNIAAGEAEIFDNVDANRFTVSKVYTTYSLFTGAVVGDVKENQEFSFTFSAEDIDAKQSIMIGEEAYYYLASAYLLAPEKVNMTGALYKDGEEYRALSFTDLPLAANTRTNIYGDMIQQEELQGWDGVTFADLSDEGLTCQVQVEGANNVLHIDTPEELANCMKNGYPSGYDAIHICANHNMGGHAWDNVANVPNGIIINGSSANGNLSHSISHVKLQGVTTGLFGNTESLKVSSLQLKSIDVKTSSDVAGVLAGTVKGNSSFSNVIVDGCSVSSEKVSGGMIGYLRRISEQKRSESVNVSFSGCQVNNTTISSNDIEGQFVGKLSGYDNGEALAFDKECSVSSNVIDYSSPYVVANQSVWATKDDEGNEIIIDTKYNGWLGTETYRRGNVTFEGKRLVPKWDGTTTIDPIVENNVKLIYSPYDVAKLQSNSHTAVTFEADVDLGSHKFNPIKSITTLDGKEHTIYNLKVDMVHDGTGAAFIQSASGTTTHKDIIFVGADIKNVHNPNIPTPAYGVTEDKGAGNAYAGTLVSHSGGTYNVSNVHVKSGKVYAVCKMGGLVGYVGGNLNMNDCSVDDYTIENYEPMVPNYYAIPGISFSSYIVNGLQWWYTNGECGGLIGFVKSPKAEIKRCTVTNSNINCVGQPNKEVIANVYEANKFDSSNPYVSGKSVFGTVKTDIAGRHVNQFIGDIVSERSEGGSNYTVIIEDYTVCGNKYFGIDASDTDNQYNHCYKRVNKGSSWKPNYEYSYCDVVGSAYYVGVDINIWIIITIKKHIMHCAGELTFNPVGKESVTITEAVGNGNDMSWTGGSFSDLSLGGKSSYPTYP